MGMFTLLYNRRMSNHNRVTSMLANCLPLSSLPSPHPTHSNAINEKMGPAFDRVPAKTLVLWNVSNKSILANRRIKDNVVALELDNEDLMSPVMSLKEVFSSSGQDLSSCACSHKRPTAQ